MTVFELLERIQPGFAELDSDERQAISEFTLLWSCFENRALDCEGRAGAIVEAATALAAAGRLNLGAFADAIAYARHRYYRDGGTTPEFDGLHLRGRRDRQELVGALVAGEALSDADALAGLLIIVLRYRTNLFHGLKWAYGIRGQLSNFQMANRLLMTMLELYPLMQDY